MVQATETHVDEREAAMSSGSSTEIGRDPSEKADSAPASKVEPPPAPTVANVELQEQAQAPPQYGQARNMKGYTWVLVVMSILSSTFLFALDNTIVADVQPKILQRLGEVEKLPWVSVSFALGAVSVNLVWGKLFGQFNSKVLFLIAVFLFEAGSAVCGAAPSMNALIVGRTICGLGGSGIYIGAMNLLSVFTTPSERPMYLSLTGLTWGAGTVLGPIIGGAFADSSATWRWSFYINLCVGAVAAPVYFILLPSHDPRPQVPLRQRLSEIDYVGIILIIGAFVSGIMAIAFGGLVYTWGSGQIIGLFVCSAVLWVLFGTQQTLCFFTTKDHRIFPIEFLKSYEMCILFAQTAAAISCAFIPIYFIPIFFQFVRNDSALDAGVRLLPFVLIMVASTILNGVVLAKTGVYMPWYTGGGILVIIGGALFYTIDINTSASRIYGYSVLSAIGAGVFSQASFSVAQAKVDPSLIPLAVAFIGCAQIGGITLALAIANTIFLNQATIKISAILPGVPIATVQAAISGAGGSLFQSLSEVDRTRVLEAIVASIDNTYVMVIAGGALSVILSLFMKRERLVLEHGGGGA